MDRQPREAPAPMPEAARGRGFRLGFATALLVGALLALPYAFAGRISAALPGASAILGAYVEAVDEGRHWLDLRLRDALQRGGAS